MSAEAGNQRTTSPLNSVKASVDLCARHLLQRLYESRHPQRHALVLVYGPDLVEGISHLSVEAAVDVLLVPLEVLQVLNPLEEADLGFGKGGVQKKRGVQGKGGWGGGRECVSSDMCVMQVLHPLKAADLGFACKDKGWERGVFSGGGVVGSVSCESAFCTHSKKLACFFERGVLEGGGRVVVAGSVSAFAGSAPTQRS